SPSAARTAAVGVASDPSTTPYTATRSPFKRIRFSFPRCPGGGGGSPAPDSSAAARPSSESRAAAAPCPTRSRARFTSMRTARTRCNAAESPRKAATIRSARANCCASAPGTSCARGSIRTTSGWVRVSPPTASRTAYRPGSTHGPRGSRGVSPGIAEMGYSCRIAGGGSPCRSHTKRCIPRAVESVCGGRIHMRGMLSAVSGCSGRSGDGEEEEEREALPVIARVERYVNAPLGPRVEQPAPHRILPHRVDDLVRRYSLNDVGPRPTAIFGAEDVGVEVVETEAVHGGVDGEGIDVRRLHKRNLAPGRQRGRGHVHP